MKFLTYLSTFAILVFLFSGCEKGIDPISSVDPGTDENAPEIVISYPQEGTLVRVLEDIGTITITLVATDDIELKDIVIKMDGVDIATYNTFKDYRRALIEHVYNNVTDGAHTLTVIVTDLTGKSTTQSVNFEKVEPYLPLPGEFIYMPFDGDLSDLVAFQPPTIKGTPGFTDGKLGQAYQGATDTYFSFPTTGNTADEFSVAFWYKVNAVPDRAGIIAVNPPAPGGSDDGNRFFGFRFAREADGVKQKFFLNVGNGTADSWFVPPSFDVTDTWMHVAISISASYVTVYINGAVATEGEFAGPINWTGCNQITFASGMPNFIYWNHLSDLSLYDELRIFKKALTAEEVTNIYTMKK